MVDVLLSLLIGLLVLDRGYALYRTHIAPSFAPKPPVFDDTALFAAVKDAAYRTGLNADALTRETNLKATGKLEAVLHDAALTLEKNPELTTVQDVMDWLKEAPTVG